MAARTKAAPAEQGPVLSIEKITPESAHTILETLNIINRPISQRQVRALSIAIQQGEWMLNGETIKFDTDGNLFDGQHRLLAIVEAGRPVETAVVRGLPAVAQDTVDMGRKRTMGNILAMRGITDSNNVARVSKLLWQYEHKHLPRRSVEQDPTPQEILDYTEEHLEVIKYALSVAQAGYKILPQMSKSTGAVGNVICYRKNRGEAQDFATRLATGENLKHRDPILVLRQRLLRNANEKRKMSQEETLACYVKAWNAFREDRPVEILSWRKDEAFPRAI